MRPPPSCFASLLLVAAVAAVALLAPACQPAASASDMAAGSGDDMGLASGVDASPLPDMAVSAACAALQLRGRPFSTAMTGTLRDERAADFTVTDQDGDWHFAAMWSGCESYVIIPDGMPVSSVDATPMWSSDLDALLTASPPNVHYFFVSRRSQAADVAASILGISSQLDGALSQFPDGDAPGQRGWWRRHVHFVKTAARDIPGWVGALLSASSTPEGFGFAIDRFQRLRGNGTFADVLRQDPAVNPSTAWPFDNNLAYAANLPVYFNYESDRQDRLDAEPSPTVITVYDHEIVKAPAAPDGGVPDGGAAPVPGTVEKDVTFPDAQTMAGFDALEVDLTMACPQSTLPEEDNNCGAWDYIVSISFLDEDGQTYDEMARFISSYHRAGRYVVDATHFLPYLSRGGTFHMQYMFAPPWNEQLADTVMQFRLINHGAGARPTKAVYLFSGGTFDPSYDTGRAPVTVAIPASAKKVELRALITGHGGDTGDDCSEFCDHHHVFTVGGQSFTKTNPAVGDVRGCLEQIATGEVPNQSGTWWYGRGGWCPGMQVDPWVVDVTAAAPAGTSVTVGYQGLFNDQPPTTTLGNIDMSSWLLIWE